MCSFMSPQGKTVTLLAFGGVGNVLSTLRHTDKGGVSAHVGFAARMHMYHAYIAR